MALVKKINKMKIMNNIRILQTGATQGTIFHKIRQKMAEVRL